MKLGDLILYPVVKYSKYGSKVDDLIAWYERRIQDERGRQYAHVGILFWEWHGRMMQVEAYFPHIRVSLVDIMRPREIWTDPKLDQHERNLIVQYALCRVGEWYDVPELFFGLFKARHTEVCSTLANDCYAAAGQKLFSHKSQWTPDQLFSSGRLKRIS